MKKFENINADARAFLASGGCITTTPFVVVVKNESGTKRSRKEVVERERRNGDLIYQAIAERRAARVAAAQENGRGNR
jgi:hypothetical protein